MLCFFQTDFYNKYTGIIIRVENGIIHHALYDLKVNNVSISIYTLLVKCGVDSNYNSMKQKLLRLFAHKFNDTFCKKC